MKIPRNFLLLLMTFLLLFDASVLDAGKRRRNSSSKKDYGKEKKEEKKRSKTTKRKNSKTTKEKSEKERGRRKNRGRQVGKKRSSEKVRGFSKRNKTKVTQKRGRIKTRGRGRKALDRAKKAPDRGRKRSRSRSTARENNGSTGKRRKRDEKGDKKEDKAKDKKENNPVKRNDAAGIITAAGSAASSIQNPNAKAQRAAKKQEMYSNLLKDTIQQPASAGQQAPGTQAVLAKPPAGQSELTKSEKLKKQEEDICVICKQSFSQDILTVVTSCDHEFDEECLKKNFATGKTQCPICDKELSDEYDYPLPKERDQEKKDEKLSLAEKLKLQQEEKQESQVDNEKQEEETVSLTNLLKQENESREDQKKEGQEQKDQVAKDDDKKKKSLLDMLKEKEEPEEKVIAECNICQSDVVKNDAYLKTDCNHIFHEDCLLPWFEKGNSTCPNCRTDLSEQFSDVIVKEEINVEPKTKTKSLLEIMKTEDAIQQKESVKQNPSKAGSSLSKLLKETKFAQ
jgi:hypothetical protein